MCDYFQINLSKNKLEVPHRTTLSFLIYACGFIQRQRCHIDQLSISKVHDVLTGVQISN